jgi:hypothetical protein
MAKPEANTNKNVNKIIIVVCLLIIVGGAIYLLAKGSDSSTSTTKVSSSNAKMFITPQSKQVSQGTELTVKIEADSEDKNVNTVEADVSYPVKYFEFESIDEAGSAFPVGVQGDAKDGVITIVRGSTKPVKGKILVGTIKLQVKDQAGSTQLDFTKDTKLFSSTTNKDILAKTSGATVTVK